MSKKLKIHRDGGLGDIIMLLTLFSDLKEKGYEIELACSRHYDFKFLEKQKYIDSVTDNRDNIDIDLNRTEHSLKYTKNNTLSVFESFKNKIEEILGVSLLARDIELVLSKESNFIVESFLSKFKKPFIIINPSSTVTNRSLPNYKAKEICENLAKYGTIINLQTKNFIRSKSVINIFENYLSPSFRTLSSLINNSDVLVTTNTSTFHIGCALKKNTICIDQSFKSSKYNVYNNPNLKSVLADPECLYCEIHTGCSAKENTGMSSSPNKYGEFPNSESFPPCSHEINVKKIEKEVKLFLS